MNETPGAGGTPNPLEPNQDAGQAATQPAQPAEAAPAEAKPAEAQPVAAAPAESTPAVVEPVAVAPEAATGDKPKKKTGLIVGIVLAVLLLVGGGVAAAIVLMGMNQPSGTVLGAMQKLMSGNASNKVAVDGDVIISINNESSPIKKIDVALDSNFTTPSMVNTSTATVTLTSNDDSTVSATFDEVYVDGGDIYFKLSGIMKVLTDSKLLYYFLAPGLTEPVDCSGTNVEDCVGSTNSDIDIEEILDTYGISDTVKLVDGEWLHVSMDEITGAAEQYTDNTSLSCLSDLTNNINKNSSAAIEHYNNNPFIIETTEGVVLPSKLYPVRLVKFDSENLAGYIDEIQNSAILKELYDCMGWKNNAKVNKSDVAEAVKLIPDLYAEVDNDNNFTRLYFETEIAEGGIDVITDLSFKYPETINVSGPASYKDFSEVIQQIFNGLYNEKTVNSL